MQELTVAYAAPVLRPTTAMLRPTTPAANVDRRPAARRGIAPATVAARPAAPLFSELSVIDVAWTDVISDPEEVIAALRSERTVARAGFDHPHTAIACAFCRRAAALYQR